MYKKPVSKEELLAFGLTEDDFAETIDIWPENHLAFNIFNYLSTQWLYNMNGMTGINYQSIPFIFELFDVKKEDIKSVFEDIREMERYALNEINKS